MTRLFIALTLLALAPLLMNLLDMGDFTPAGMILYLLTFLAVGIPALHLAVQHVRDTRRHAHGRS